jgi:hypothetical protein
VKYSVIVKNPGADPIRNARFWVYAPYALSAYQARNNGAVRTLMTKTGDCTEAMYLFSALSRASGIPSRNLAGFLAKESGLLKSRNYHNWVEILIDGKWQLVDPDKRIFMDRETDYIAMSVLGGVEVNGFPEKQRFFAGTDNITLTMN